MLGLYPPGFDSRSYSVGISTSGRAIPYSRSISDLRLRTMDLNAKDLLDQVHRLTTSLVRRYTDIMSRLPLIQQERPQSDKDNEDDFFKPTQINRNRVAVNNLQMEIDAQGLVDLPTLYVVYFETNMSSRSRPQRGF